MEGEERGQPPSDSAANKEETSQGTGVKYPTILPSIKSQGRTQSPGPQPPPQARLSPYDHGQGYAPPPGFLQPQATPRSQTVQRGPSAEGAIPPSPIPFGHAPYSTSGPGTGTYSPSPTVVTSSASGFPPVQSYPNFGSFQPPAFGYGTSGQGYPYGFPSTAIPYPTVGGAVSQSGYAMTRSSYQGVGPDPTFAGGSQAYPYYGNEFPQQYQGQSGYVNYQTQRKGEGRSWARNPGRPIYNEGNESGPSGANLFVFHVPNDMTNQGLYNLFCTYGNVLSAAIQTERSTGRGRGYAFVNYDSVDSAAAAIEHLNGYQIGGKRLKVTHKKIEPERRNVDRSRSQPHSSQAGYVPTRRQTRPYHPRQRQVLDQLPATGFLPVQEHAGPTRHHSLEVHSDRSPGMSFVPVQDLSVPPELHLNEPRRDRSHASGFVPVQASARSPEPCGHDASPPQTVECGSTPVLPPITDLEGAGRGAKSHSPLADLTDIGDALPDLSEK